MPACPAYNIRDTTFWRRQADFRRAFTKMATQVPAIACLFDGGMQLYSRDERHGAFCFSSSHTRLQSNEQRSSFLDWSNEDFEQSRLISFLQTFFMLITIWALIRKSWIACFANDRRSLRPRVFPNACRDGVKTNFLGPDGCLTVTCSWQQSLLRKLLIFMPNYGIILYMY